MPTSHTHCLDAHFHSRAIPYPSCVTPSVKQLALVQESLPVVHRLRLSASGWVPTNPERTSLPQETLDIRWKDSHPSFATHTGILTSKRSTSPSGLTSPPLERSPTHEPLKRFIHSFGNMFSPGTFSARGHSTSELLRTLSMVAASKPTSWLSKQPHILFHLTYIWGPYRWWSGLFPF